MICSLIFPFKCPFIKDFPAVFDYYLDPCGSHSIPIKSPLKSHKFTHSSTPCLTRRELKILHFQCDLRVLAAA